MKIVLIASFAESLINFRGPLLKALVEAGHNVHSAAPGLVPGSEIGDRLTKLGVSIIDIPLSRTGLNPVTDLRLGLRLWQLFRKDKYDVVIGYTIKPVIWGMLAGKAASVPHRVAIITGLGYAFAEEAKGVRRLVRSIAIKLYRLALRQANLIFFQNPDDQADFAALGILPPNTETAIVNGSGVDLDFFALKPVPRGSLRFLLIARLLGDKGIREFAEAAKALKAEKASVEFHLVGPIDSNPDSLPESLVNHWHDTDVLCWHGGLSDVRPAISSSHVFVLPSYREGTPRTVLEAMSMGRPIITTDTPGCRETVVDGVNGFLVPVRNAEALAGAMRKFIDSPDLISRMGAQSRRIAEEKYDVRKVNIQMMEAMGL
jgi:glycosyltransferase involved in cell wall biosynthesis